MVHSSVNWLRWAPFVIGILIAFISELPLNNYLNRDSSGKSERLADAANASDFPLIGEPSIGRSALESPRANPIPNAHPILPIAKSDQSRMGISAKPSSDSPGLQNALPIPRPEFESIHSTRLVVDDSQTLSIPFLENDAALSEALDIPTIPVATSEEGFGTHRWKVDHQVSHQGGSSITAMMSPNSKAWLSIGSSDKRLVRFWWRHDATEVRLRHSEEFPRPAFHWTRVEGLETLNAIPFLASNSNRTNAQIWIDHVTVEEPISIGEALDSSLSFEVEGAGNWMGWESESLSFDGEDFLTYDPKGPGRLMTEVHGSGTLSFRWRYRDASVSRLHWNLLVDGEPKETLSNHTVDDEWIEVNHYIDTPGNHTIAWDRYLARSNSKRNEIWMDTLRWTPSLEPNPIEKGFDWSTDWTSSGLSDGGWEVDTTVTMDGEDSLRLSVSRGNGGRLTMPPLPESASVTFYYRTEGVLNAVVTSDLFESQIIVPLPETEEWSRIDIDIPPRQPRAQMGDQWRDK